jgi:hypothetical protein
LTLGYDNVQSGQGIIMIMLQEEKRKKKKKVMNFKQSSTKSNVLI